jgi:hypothetical protein
MKVHTLLLAASLCEQAQCARARDLMLLYSVFEAGARGSKLPPEGMVTEQAGTPRAPGTHAACRPGPRSLSRCAPRCSWCASSCPVSVRWGRPLQEGR